AQCSADNTQATLTWSSVNGASSYALRVDYKANDGPGCVDGWYCGDPPDKLLNFYGSTSYVASVIPGQAYDFWVHGVQGSSYGSAASGSFTCGQAAPFDYSLTNSGNISVSQGGSGSNTITRTLLSGSPQSVNLSASGLPAGATASFSNNPC